MPDGSKDGLTFAWKVTPSPNISCVIDGPLNPKPNPIGKIHCVFGKTPQCGGFLNESATVEVTVANACGASAKATRKMPITCSPKFSGCF